MKLQLHVLVLEQALVLAGDRVLGPGQDLDEGGLVEVVERRHHGEAAHELRDEAVLDEVGGLDLAEEVRLVLGAAPRALRVGLEAERLLAHPPLDHLVEADEGAAADEQDVRGVDLVELLVRVLAPALGRHVGDRALEDLEQRLLDALPGHVAGDRGVLVLARDLVDLVDVDDPFLALLDVAARGLQELQDDVLDVLADVAGLGEGRRVHDREGHGEQAGEGLGEERLAGPGRPDEQDVRLGELDVVAAPLLADLDPLVVVVDRDRELLLGLLLADHVLVEELLDLLRGGEAGAGGLPLGAAVVRDDVVADVDALVADEDGGAGDQLADVVLVLVAERAAQDLAVGSRLLGRGHYRSRLEITWSTTP